MFEAWGRFLYRRRRLVLLVAAMVMVGASRPYFPASAPSGETISVHFRARSM